MLEADDGRSDIYTSVSTGDILLPKIAVCKSCHTTSAAEGHGIHGARTDCLECHIYHQRDFEQQGSKDLQEFLNVTGKSQSGD
jgi:hypothetical protein